MHLSGGVIEVGIVADIASDAAKPIVLDLELASTMPAPKQSDRSPPPLRTEPGTMAPFMLALPEMMLWLRSYSSHEM